MLLLKSAEHQCLNEIAARLPELLLTANINISTTSQNQLAEMIKGHVRFNYFPTGADTIVQVITLPITLLAMAFSPYAVVIDSKCGNAELTNISYEKRKLLDQLIFDRILSKYRDHAREAEIQMESQQRLQSRITERASTPVTFSQTYPRRRSTLDSERYRTAQDLPSAEEIDRIQDPRVREEAQNLRIAIVDAQSSFPRPCVLM